MELTRILLTLASFLLATSSAASPRKCRESTLQSPALYENYPDNGVSIGPDNTFYFSASNFHHSPNIPILRSFNLMN
ncbi:hypothetical protein CORC01_04603 [Colletotrichum orchidophilum]|uniref:Uncharacterized protein n=1 Tax=Colletotrichum orchidophilum TaxID=1209926 RepID=A0A1G4BFQ4_9PEZI|nr:uncharacterized protein CORC01_04603 [Colletotrichum orchidophilum]OHF00195.1 hypothetical protein CORC01_04603 [Colletotrichum orchidophilum]